MTSLKNIFTSIKFFDFFVYEHRNANVMIVVDNVYRRVIKLNFSNFRIDRQFVKFKQFVNFFEFVVFAQIVDKKNSKHVNISRFLFKTKRYEKFNVIKFFDFFRNQKRQIAKKWNDKINWNSIFRKRMLRKIFVDHSLTKNVQNLQLRMLQKNIKTTSVRNAQFDSNFREQKRQIVKKWDDKIN